MAIKDLEVNQSKVDVEGKITELGEVREFSKFGREGRVCNATVKDDSGSVKLTLWNEQIDMVKEGDTVKVKNGYVKEWQGEKQLSVGKYGSLEIV
ncbi:TPA: hypothetical protein HA239_05085 [Candidatus Woesearchaeota archaeon]|nr:Nucleic acid binding OB-fold tRNA/helicase-type [archaeon GW2011_AR15]MBS3103641.1 hypothetical protein [Candidatus Woesearchaeota archaeon]HIH41758.1 hypothetical protein [Candidatus Woesearchaeota archaeon]